MISICFMVICISPSCMLYDCVLLVTYIIFIPVFCLVVTHELTICSWFSLTSDTGCGGVSHGHAGHGHVLFVLLGYDGDGVVVADHQTVLVSFKHTSEQNQCQRLDCKPTLWAWTCSSSKSKQLIISWCRAHGKSDKSGVWHCKTKSCSFCSCPKSLFLRISSASTFSRTASLASSARIIVTSLTSSAMVSFPFFS